MRPITPATSAHFRLTLYRILRHVAGPCTAWRISFAWRA